MISLLVAAMLSRPQQPQQNAPDGAALISKMMRYYAGATSMVGTIHMLQQAQGLSVPLDTTIDYQAPSKIYLSQVLGGPHPRSWLVTSDGQSFTYDYPNERRFSTTQPEPGRLWESVKPAKGVREGFRQIFRAALFSLGDVSIPVLLSIGGRDEMMGIKDEIATIRYAGQQQLGGETVDVVEGGWKPSAKSPASAQYQMFIASDGELKRFVQVEAVSVKLPQMKMAPEQVVTTWELNLHVGGQPDESLFKVVK